jgi:hypothetical protein
VGRHHAIALHRLAELLFGYLVDHSKCDAERVARMIGSDYLRGGRRDVPDFLRQYVPPEDRASVRAIATAPRRQARHLAE